MHPRLNHNLVEAIRSNDKASVVRLLEKGASPNRLLEDGNNAFHIACRKGRVSLVKVLLDAGAKVSARTKDGETPLHVAATWGQCSVLKELLDHGADVTLRDDDGCAPLHYAALHSGRQTVQVLVESGANVNATNSDGTTPLMCAVIWACGSDGNLTTTDYLLACHADINARNRYGKYACTWAILRTSVLEHLIGRGADITVADVDGNSLLDHAIKEHSLGSCELLIRQGLRPSASNLVQLNRLGLVTER